MGTNTLLGTVRRAFSSQPLFSTCCVPASPPDTGSAGMDLALAHAQGIHNAKGETGVKADHFNRAARACV